jgi:hypothetical protein
MVAPASARAASAPPKTDSWQVLYQDRINDPYGGEYAADMVYFSEEDPVQGPQAPCNMVIASSSNMGVLIGMFSNPHHKEFHSLSIHGIEAFEAVLSRPTEWDAISFAFVNDVMSGQVHTVEVLPVMFNRTRNEVSIRVNDMITNVNQA